MQGFVGDFGFNTCTYLIQETRIEMCQKDKELSNL